MTIMDWQKYLNEIASKHGFWEKGATREVIIEKLILIHSEVTEAYECIRTDPNPFYSYYTNDKPEGFVIELADIIIRILDLAEQLGVNLEHAIIAKSEYNKTRPYKHGRSKEST